MRKRLGAQNTLPLPTYEETKSFLDLKHALLNPPILCLSQYDKPYIIHVDASKGRLGRALLQGQRDGKFWPVGYWSRTQNKAQSNYSATERECHCVFSSILHLKIYLEGTRFTVRIDHHAVKWALFISNAEKRQANWRFRRAEFYFDVVYRPDVENEVHDAVLQIETTDGKFGPLNDSILCPDSLPLEDIHDDIEQILLIVSVNLWGSPHFIPSITPSSSLPPTTI